MNTSHHVMRLNGRNYPTVDIALLEARANAAEREDAMRHSPEEVVSEREWLAGVEVVEYSSHFTDCMEMNADAKTVAAYLDAHQEWFRRCAQPMRVDPLGPNAYALVIGRFGALGYEIEPKIGLDLLPQQQGVYRIATVPIPNDDTSGYAVDFQAAMNLVEVPVAPNHPVAKANPRTGTSQSPTGSMTRVEWQLDLTVAIQFPRFLQRLPKTLIQTTGDRLLRQIVRQVSRRLTYRVQQDFHTALGLPMPNSAKKAQFSSLR